MLARMIFSRRPSDILASWLKCKLVLLYILFFNDDVIDITGKFITINYVGVDSAADDLNDTIIHIDYIDSNMVANDLDRWKVQICDVDADILTIATARITTYHGDTFGDGNCSVPKPWVLKYWKYPGYLYGTIRFPCYYNI